jgi:hypothetical protein
MNKGKDMASFTCFLIGSDTLLQECGDILRRWAE